MKRYNSTPNRLSYTTGKHKPSGKRYTVNWLPLFIIFAIALIIMSLVYRSCNCDNKHKPLKTKNTLIPDKPIIKHNDVRHSQHKKSEIPAVALPNDSIPPETNLKIITD
ncbi:MAG: hypothetical protein N3F66_02600 [Spirochaetes bacterium]|nr:hypothetical protein [Spirochaetota bacterium]